MKKTSTTIIFFGNERLATGVATRTPTLKALIAAGYKVAAIVSNYEQSKSRNARLLEIEQVAHEHDIPLFLPDKLSDIADELRQYKARAGVLVAYGKLVPESIINSFPNGIVNIHPSLLPLHRGPTPIESVILNGERKTGVSLMQLVKAMDAGPIYAQEKISIKDFISKQELADTLLDMGTSLLIKHLPSILDRSLAPMLQDEAKATYDNKIEKRAGLLDWTKPARQLEREIRAFASWPKSRTTIAGKDIIINQAHAVDGTGTAGDVIVLNKQLYVATAEGRLSIERLTPLGRQEMTIEAFLAGYGRSLPKSN